ncbi:MAG: hypothetical protein NC038_06045 [Paludibacter sp.]|nr:hypothetical protein [Bacteroidales bacterium]MCM1069306.1 hypothetical protein [Prevotella sp.]MCM1353711.1 hypothetical protein [Bacteroides sp.]MCM1442221.1 hypothetical protein [Muribaculum sp.]MCM1482183.1 hypothetical protein [Paludibacter sp.]
MNIAHYIFRYHQQKHNNKQHPAFPDYANIKRILLLFESDNTEQNPQIAQIIRQLQAEGKQVTAWGYAEKKQITTSPDDAFRLLGKQDIGLFGRPRKELIRILQSSSYDLLIDLSLQDTLPTAWLALAANATFKTGRVQSEEPYVYHFMIQTNEQTDQQYLCKQILFYLRSIKTTDRF